MTSASMSTAASDPLETGEKHGHWLILDTSTPIVRAGILHDNRWVAYVSSDRPTHEALDWAVREACFTCSRPPHQMDGFAYCQGPGSILGIRLAIISIKAWRALRPAGRDAVPVYAFTSLEIAAETIANNSDNPTEPFAIVAEWKKNAWNALTVFPDSGHGRTPIEIWDPDKMASWPHRLHVIEQRKQWTPLPPDVARITPDPDCLTNPVQRARLLSPATSWPIYSPEEKQYIVWSGERHRAPDTAH